MERKEVDRFVRFWEPLFQKVPEARAEAVKAMGEAMAGEVQARIQAADLERDARGTVVSWQELRLGSRGGYAAVSPIKGKTVLSRDRLASGTRLRQHTYKGKAVTSKQITGWLEKGHGARYAKSTGAYAWSRRRWNREWRIGFNDKTNTGYVAGRQFYSFARLTAWDAARKAADRVLSKIADEVDY